MSWWERFKVIFKQEATDVKEGLGNVGKSLDAELAHKERELAATPEERIDMLLEEQQAGDARFQELQDRVLGTQAEAEAIEEVGEALDPPAPAETTAAEAIEEVGESLDPTAPAETTAAEAIEEVGEAAGEEPPPAPGA